MDGVLTDFQKGYNNALKNYLSNNKLNNTNLSSIYNNLYLNLPATFWSNLDWITGGKDLYNISNKLFANIKILSSSGTSDPIKSNDIKSAKLQWLNNNIPSIHNNNVIVVPNKHLKKNYATNNAILIDDTPSNISEWTNAGGISILHNSSNYKNSIKKLVDILLYHKLQHNP